MEVIRREAEVTTDRDALAEPPVLDGVQWSGMRALLQSHPLLAGQWSSFIRQLSPSHPTAAVLNACRTLSSFLLPLFATSHLLPRFLLYRCTVPDTLWPLLIQSQPALAHHVFPHILALLSSSDPRRSLSALHLLACVRLDGGVKNRWKPRLGDVLARLLERLSGQRVAGGAEEDRRGDKKKKGKKRKAELDEVAMSANGAIAASGEVGLDEVAGVWVRRGIAALLLLAQEYGRYSHTLLTLVKQAAGVRVNGAVRDGGNGGVKVEGEAERRMQK